MVRLILLCVILASGIGGAYWLSRNSGELSFFFLEYHVKTTVTEFVVYLALAVIVLQIFSFFLYKLFSIPAQIKQKFRDKKKDKIITNITSYFSDYIGRNIKSLEGKYSLIKDTVEQIDQVSMAYMLEDVKGDILEIKNKLTMLTKFDKTKIAAFTKLIEIAMQERDWFIAANYCSELWKINKTHLNARNYVTCFIKANRWRELEEILGSGSFINSLFSKDINHYLGRSNSEMIRSICQYKIAQELVEMGDVNGARNKLLPILKNFRGFIPATLLALKLCKDDDSSAIIKIIKAQWKIAPHYLVSQEIAELSNKVLDQKLYKIVKGIAAYNPEHYESNIILARAALDSDNFDAALKHISDALAGVKKLRASLLMAEFCQRTHANKSEITDWLRQALSAADDRHKIRSLWDFEKAEWVTKSNSNSILI